jgi:hypothetical protein
MVVSLEVYSTLSGGTAASASASGPDLKSGLNMVGTHAPGAGLSYSWSHSAASKCVKAAAQAQSGMAKVLDRVSNPIQGHWRVER